MLLGFASSLSALCTLAAAFSSPSTALGIPSSTDGTALTKADFLPAKTSSLQYDVFPLIVDAKVHYDTQRYDLDLARSAYKSTLQKIGTSPNIFTVAQRGPRRRPSLVLPNRWSSGNDP